MTVFDAIPTITSQGLPVIVTLVAIFARISAIAFFLPGMGEQMISMRVRLGGAFAMAMIVAPAVLTNEPFIVTPAIAAKLIAAEAITGALIGFSIKVAIFALQIAGSIISQALSLSQLMGTSIDLQPETPLSMLLMMSGIVLSLIHI